MTMPPDAAGPALARAGERIGALEARVRAGSVAIEAVLPACIAATAEAMRAALVAAGRPDVGGDADILDAWQALVKGEPTWNAIRDNCRELVYYRNCLAASRRDALPAAPERMAVRTARHVYVYVRTRALREGWAVDD